MLQFKQSPNEKLQHIYETFKVRIARDVDHFWNNCSMRDGSYKGGPITVDIDNLLGIVIYIVHSTKYPEIISECFITSEFNCGTRAMSFTTPIFFIELQFQF